MLAEGEHIPLAESGHQVRTRIDEETDRISFLAIFGSRRPQLALFIPQKGWRYSFSLNSSSLHNFRYGIWLFAGIKFGSFLVITLRYFCNCFSEILEDKKKVEAMLKKKEEEEGKVG